MRSHKVIFGIGLITMLLTLGGCRPLSPTEELYRPYSEFKTELNDQLSACKTFVDSIIVIRHYAHLSYRCGRPSSDISRLGYTRLADWQAEKWYEEFNADAFSGKCGIAAQYLNALYKSYGFHAFTIQIGFNELSDPRGHAQTLVAQGNHCVEKLDEFYLMDPMFDYHYAVAGRPLSFTEVVKLLVSDASDPIQLVSGVEREPALHLQNRRILTPFFPEFEKTPEAKVYKSKHPKSKYLVEAPRTIERYMAAKKFRRVYRNIVMEKEVETKMESYRDFRYTTLAVTAFYSCASDELEEQYWELLKREERE